MFTRNNIINHVMSPEYILKGIISGKPQPLNKIIGEHVASVLVTLGATKQGTARRAGIAPSTFRRSLTGERGLTVDEVWRVSQALGVDPGELFPPKDAFAAEMVRQRAEEETKFEEDAA